MRTRRARFSVVLTALFSISLLLTPATPAPSLPASFPLPAITLLSSPTNDVVGWSRHNEPLFIWSAVPGASGYSWIVDHARDTQPDAVADDGPLGFREPRTYLAPGDPGSVSLGDFNGDGLPDLYVGGSGSFSHSGSVGVLMSRRSLGGVDYVPWSRSLAAWGAFLTVADLNGDGADDIAVAENAADQVEVLISSGSGNVVSQTVYPVGDQPRGLATGDFNGDGRPDLAVAHGENFLALLLGDGNGGFTRATPDLVTGYWPTAVVVGDFNEDGNADLAATTGTGDGTVSILLGSGDGTFAEHVDYAVASVPQDLVCGDLDGDGHLDLAVACTFAETISVLRGSGDGTFQPRRDDVVGFSVQALAPPVDLDGDGHVDLTTTDRDSGDAVVLLGDGEGSFSPPLSFAAGAIPHGVVAADLDQDGLPDLATSSDSGRVSILLGVPRPVTRCTFGPLVDGVWYFHLRAVADGSVGPVSSRRLLIDTTKPRPVARSSSARTGEWSLLRFRIRDARPGSPTAVVKIRIYRNGKFVQLLKCRRKVNVEASLRFLCTLPKGPYRFYVLAIDQAGNHQQGVGNAPLTVL